MGAVVRAPAWKLLKTVANTQEQTQTVANTATIAVANKHGVYADKQKRREYMRNYMRNKRAKSDEA